MDHRFGKHEKLKSKTQITALFSSGQAIKRFPVKLVYRPIEASSNKVGVSVPKRNFKRAVDRNKIKRLLRESYRLNKQLLTDQSEHYAIMIIYIGKKTPQFQRLFKTVNALLHKLDNTKTL